MKCIIGKKVEMSQIYQDENTVVPVTIVEAGPCVVTQISAPRDGRASIGSLELGWGFSKRLNKAQQGHLKGLGSFRHLKSFRMPALELKNFERGSTIDAEIFQVGDRVNVSGLSKGKGFQGVVRRHHFKGSPASHGHKDQLRMPGSSGAGGLQRVPKGKRMAGRMGNARSTVKNLIVVKVNEGLHQLWLKGAVPGARGNILTLISREK